MSQTSLQAIKTIVEAYDDLLERAKLVIGAPPYFTCCDEPEHFRIAIDGDTVIASWPEAHHGYYDSMSIEVQSVKFPLDLMLADIATIQAWASEQRRLNEKRRRKEQAEASRFLAEQVENNERNELERLAAKYGVVLSPTIK